MWNISNFTSFIFETACNSPFIQASRTNFWRQNDYFQKFPITFTFWLLKLFKVIKGKKNVTGTCFEYGPIFRHFEFFNSVKNWAKLRYYTVKKHASAKLNILKIEIFHKFKTQNIKKTPLGWLERLNTVI